VQFVAFFGPLVGLVLGFDTINRERSQGTLSKLLSQPIYRDVVINGKFLAGVVMISIMMVSIVLVITGLGLIVLGIIPGLEEIWRIMIYLIISIIYVSFWRDIRPGGIGGMDILLIFYFTGSQCNGQRVGL
jgi:ABC-2 type transport system permease protein